MARQRVYPEEIAGLREALLTQVLPALPDAALAADARADEVWQQGMSQASDGSDDAGEWAERAEEEGAARYARLAGIRQAMLNMGTVMLWHLWEQQILCFHGRQILQSHEEQAACADPKIYKKLYTLKEFEKRLADGGYALDRITTWPKVNELRLVANTAKHGAGESADTLYALRPDLFTPPGCEDLVRALPIGAAYVERPAAGEDLYVTKRNLAEFFDAATQFWGEFSRMIQE
jgi:hypothetical protein